MLEDVLVNAHITDARRHDRKAFELPADRRGVLWIADRGYTDHTLFAEIADGHGYFLVRLKTSSLPTITTGKPAVIRAFIAATLVGWALTQLICAAMRTERPRCEPSQYRVFALLLANLGSLVEAAAAGRHVLRERLDAFRAALWREGVNPNPGRPYARERHLAAVEK